VSSATSSWRSSLLLDCVFVAGLHVIACMTARALGFDHVSDDDFARVTIAQAFAHAPRLDPSGTSWLPAPFWLLGGLLVFDRSLAVARAASILLASVAAATPYVALRFANVTRQRALFATALGFGTPWALWLGAATVPESFTASLTAAGIIGLASCRTASFVPPALSALALGLACLSRYEAWPVAAVAAVALAMRAVNARRRSSPTFGPDVVAALLCVLGPVLWMAWNAHAHDGPLHFFRRVASYRQRIGEGSTDLVGAIMLYPRLLVTTRPELLTGLALLPSLLRDPALRRRWGLPLLAAAAQVLFLAYGNVRDGAPTHHPERALLGPLLLFALFTGDAGLEKLKSLVLQGRIRLVRIIVAAMLAVWATWIARGAEMPGRAPSEQRGEQIARGEALSRDAPARIVVTPCAFEHFALLAAYGAPENADVRPRTGEPLTERCPDIAPR
jgi:hypothetical protein